MFFSAENQSCVTIWISITDGVVALKKNDSTALVTGCKIVSRLIKLHCRNDIGYTQDRS